MDAFVTPVISWSYQPSNCKISITQLVAVVMVFACREEPATVTHCGLGDHVRCRCAPKIAAGMAAASRLTHPTTMSLARLCVRASRDGMAMTAPCLFVKRIAMATVSASMAHVLASRAMRARHVNSRCSQSHVSAEIDAPITAWASAAAHLMLVARVWVANATLGVPSSASTSARQDMSFPPMSATAIRHSAR